MSNENQETKPKFPSKAWLKVPKNRNIFIGVCCGVVLAIVIVILGVSGVLGNLGSDDSKLPAGLSCIEIDNGAAYEISKCDVNTEGTIKIPATYNGKPITHIGDNAFLDCTKITKVTMSNNITRIGDNAFKGCTELGKYSTDITISTGLTSIGKDAFLNTKLWNDHMDNYLVFVGHWIVGFKGDVDKYILNDLEKISLGTTTVGVADYAFLKKEIIILTTGNGVSYIGKSAFSGCSLMTSATIGTNVKHIDTLAFDYCTTMTSVTILGKTTIIENDAFSHNFQLKDIYFAGTEAQWTAINSGVVLPAEATIHYNYAG